MNGSIKIHWYCTFLKAQYLRFLRCKKLIFKIKQTKTQYKMMKSLKEITDRFIKKGVNKVLFKKKIL